MWINVKTEHKIKNDFGSCLSSILNLYVATKTDADKRISQWSVFVNEARQMCKHTHTDTYIHDTRNIEVVAMQTIWS